MGGNMRIDSYTLFICLVIIIMPGCSNNDHVPGGPCTYIEYPGTAEIISNDPEVRFNFTPDDSTAPSRYLFPNFPDTNHVLWVGAGTDRPSPEWIVDQGLLPGSIHRCIRTEMTFGTCAPYGYEFPDLDYTGAYGSGR